MQLADYEYYRDIFHGTKLTEESFPGYALKASVKVDHYTFGRAAKVTDTATLELINQAVCAVAEEMLFHSENPVPSGIESESNDGYSVSYSKTAKAAREWDIREIIAEYLAPTGLMYRGVLRND